MSIGPSKASEILRTALAMGADSAVHVTLPNEAPLPEPLGVARVLAAVAKDYKPDLVIMGKQAIDDDSCATGQMLAGLLDWSQATFASKVTISDDSKTAEVVREIDGGGEEIRITLPAIITTDLR